MVTCLAHNDWSLHLHQLRQPRRASHCLKGQQNTGAQHGRCSSLLPRAVLKQRMPRWLVRTHHRTASLRCAADFACHCGGQRTAPAHSGYAQFAQCPCLAYVAVLWFAEHVPQSCCANQPVTFQDATNTMFRHQLAASKPPASSSRMSMTQSYHVACSESSHGCWKMPSVTACWQATLCEAHGAASCLSSNTPWRTCSPKRLVCTCA